MSKALIAAFGGLLLGLAVAASALAAAPNVSLWRGAQAGMTYNQVRRLFPSSHAPAHEDRLIIVDQAEELLEMTDALTQGRAADVKLYFVGGKLFAVVASLRGPSVDLAYIRRVVALTTAQRGAPLECNLDARYVMGCIWLGPAVAVTSGALVAPPSSGPPAQSRNFLDITSMPADFYRKIGGRRCDPAAAPLILAGGARGGARC